MLGEGELRLALFFAPGMVRVNLRNLSREKDQAFAVTSHPSSKHQDATTSEKQHQDHQGDGVECWYREW